MSYTKPYLPVPKQVQRLQDRGLQISDRARAEAYLRRIGYYRLSGYWYPFREAVTTPAGRQVLDTFRPGVDFATVVELYVFDKKLRLLMLDAIERIEVALRASVALRHGQYGGLAYRDPKALHGNFAKKINPKTGTTGHRTWLDRVDEAFRTSREDFAVHFKTRYAGDMAPIWIAVEAWDYGSLSIFFHGMTRRDQDAIAQEYGVPDGPMLATWIRSLNHVRNIVAHHSRLWNKPLVNQPQFPRAGVIADLDHLAADVHGQTRLYGAAAVARHLLRTINPTTSWPRRLATLAGEFPANPYVRLRNAGFPSGWSALPLWRA